MLLTPLLTEADPDISSEGSGAPLGLYPIADSLATRLVPGVRERQSHPRFLTAIAVSLAVCSEFDEERIAADKISEPWQVFEWYMVEGLVRRISDGNRLRGLPGRDKADQAIRDKVPLSANRYLKTPSVYGFHGVYRLLSRTLGLEVAGQLGELGYELLTTWANEQGLTGFYDSSKEPARDLYDKLVSAVDDGLKIGTVARKDGWSGWRFFEDHLAHDEIGRKEARVIRHALLDTDSIFRGQLLEFLISPKGQQLALEEYSERRVHRELASDCDAELRELLHAIMAYETFARLLQDAFDDCLYRMSTAKGKVSPKEFTSLRGVVRAHEKLPIISDELVQALAPFPEELNQFTKTFQGLVEPMPIQEWIEFLLEHHRRIQRRKPPNGKAPWFDQFDDGMCVIRTPYIRDNGGRYDNEYVHGYRTGSLWSFARDLRMMG